MGHNYLYPFKERRKMKICAHTLVRNEEKYVWYAAMSVINYVDEVMLWDMKSTDNTYEIFKEIKKRFPKKVILRQTNNDNPSDFTKLRQQMLEETKADWVIIVDGDEVWWDEKASEISSLIKERGTDLDSVVSQYLNLIGDIYHFQDEKASHYFIDGKKGCVTIRAFNTKIPGLHYDKPHGTQGIFNGDGVLIQEMDKKKRFHTADVSYLHFTHLSRSVKDNDLKVVKRAMKYKHELGISFPPDFYYPEVFFRPRPSIVDSVWSKRSLSYQIRAFLETPPKKLRRRLFKLPEGY